MSDNTPNYKTYQRKYKKKNNNGQNLLTIFVAAFLIMLIFFTGLAKQITPKIDVSIGEDNIESDNLDSEESGMGVKKFIDDRLKSIQMDDLGKKQTQQVRSENIVAEKKAAEENIFEEELDEKVIIPKKKQEKEEVKEEKKQPEKLAVPQPKPVAPVPTQTTFVKVVVGSYSTMEQAKAAQEVLQTSGIGVTPFIKSYGGTYTLQVGSFSTEEKANALARELIKQDFPARIIK